MSNVFPFVIYNSFFFLTLNLFLCYPLVIQLSHFTLCWTISHQVKWYFILTSFSVGMKSKACFDAVLRKHSLTFDGRKRKGANNQNEWWFNSSWHACAFQLEVKMSVCWNAADNQLAQDCHYYDRLIHLEWQVMLWHILNRPWRHMEGGMEGWGHMQGH